MTVHVFALHATTVSNFDNLETSTTKNANLLGYMHDIVSHSHTHN
jgi:hypothetical protein